MKKLLTLLLTAALATAAATTAFADTSIEPGTDGNPNPETGTTNVSYTVQPSYTVTIPGTVTLDSTTQKSTATVKVENVTVPYDQKVKVAVTGTNQNNEFKVKSNEGAVLTYSVKNGNNVAELNNTVLEVASNAADKKGSTTLTFEITDAVVYSGIYTGTATFTVSVG